MCVCVLCRGSDFIQPVGLAVPVDGWTHPSPAERGRAGARLDDDSAPTVGFAFCMLHRILCCLLLRDRCAPGAMSYHLCLPACLCGCISATPVWLCTSVTTAAAAATAREDEATSTIVRGEAHPRESIRQAAAAEQSRAAHARRS